MRKLMKIFLVVFFSVVFFGGCNQVRYVSGGQGTENTNAKIQAYLNAGSALEASWVAINLSQAEINLAVARGQLSALDGRTILSVQTIAGQKNQSKSVWARSVTRTQVKQLKNLTGRRWIDSPAGKDYQKNY